MKGKVVWGLVAVAIGIVAVGYSYSTHRQENSSPQQITPVPTQQQEQPEPTKQLLSATYRCWSFHIDGSGGGACRTQPSLVLQQDGTYTFSTSEKGTYEIRDGKLYLSASKIRGAGLLLENDMQIRFEYDYNGRHYTMTYLKQE